MSSEPGQSKQLSESTSGEQHQEASPSPMGTPAADPVSATQQTSAPPLGYQPFPYSYAAYPPYPSYQAYSPSSPYSYSPYSPYSPYLYSAYPYYPMPAAPTTNGLAIASFICGLLTLFAFPYLGIAAVICGHLALGQIRSSGGFVEGKGFAMAGLILGYVMLGLGIIGFLLYFLFVFVLISRPIPAGFVFPHL